MKALIAMSGGVDSSVAACLMKEKGYDCIGVTMKLFGNSDINISREHSCCSLDDVEDARSVAYKLGMPYYVFNFCEGFKEKVIDNFVCCYEKGITPNPCIECNRHMKFSRLFDKARELSCDYIVTGHYAVIEYNEETGRYNLKKAKDDTKDQTYVLYSMTQEQLAHTLFPLGGLKKSEAREIAGEHGFINASKAESQDICFVPDGDYASFIESFTGKKYPEGDFVDNDGNVIGRHKGIIRYTIGQRKGLGIAAEKPYFVTDINVADNTVTLSHNEGLFAKGVIADNINLISVDHVEGSMRITAKIRYRHKEQAGTLTQEGEKLKVIFDEPVRAATKGQALVIYDGDNVVGGGTICDIIKE